MCIRDRIKTGETLTIEGVLLTESQSADIRNLPHVFQVDYKDSRLVVRCEKAKHNLVRVLEYLQKQEVSFGRVFSELPTLNDVFLEITGKELRD